MRSPKRALTLKPDLKRIGRKMGAETLSHFARRFCNRIEELKSLENTCQPSGDQLRMCPKPFTKSSFSQDQRATHHESKVTRHHSQPCRSPKLSPIASQGRDRQLTQESSWNTTLVSDSSFSFYEHETIYYPTSSEDEVFSPEMIDEPPKREATSPPTPATIVKVEREPKARRRLRFWTSSEEVFHQPATVFDPEY